MELIKLTEDKKALFIEMNQEAFQRGFEAYFGKTSQTIIPKKDIIASLNATGSHAYLALKDGEVVGGVCVVVDESTSVNDLHLLFVKPENQSKGVGFGIWSAVLQLHPAAKWKTCTPYFDKRNIYFYLKGTSKNYLKRNLWLTSEPVSALFCLKIRQIHQYFPHFKTKNR